MIIPQGKTEFIPIKSKNDYFEEFHQKRTFKNFIFYFLIFIIFVLFILLYFSISINNNKFINLNSQISRKDEEIKRITDKLNNFNQQKEKQHIKIVEKKNIENRDIDERLSLIEREFLYDLNFYKKYKKGINYNMNLLEYESIMFSHLLEKGMEHFELRPFGKEKARNLMSLIKNQSKLENYKSLFSIINGVNTLREYKKIYEAHGWDNYEEYKKVKEFLKDYNDIEFQKAGAFILTKKELEIDYNIDYLKFIKSRHSTRNYKKQPIKSEDVKKAVEMAKYSASACNRQFIKLHFYPSGKMRDNVIHYASGKGGLYLEGVNTFIVTFDVNGLSWAGERNQGYFNAGLYSTNLINAFHSLGIGTCFIEFANSSKDEEELKKMNDIPEYERIAVIIFAGYYDEKSIFTVSPRKNIEDILIEHK